MRKNTGKKDNYKKVGTWPLLILLNILDVSIIWLLTCALSSTQLFWMLLGFRLCIVVFFPLGGSAGLEGLINATIVFYHRNMINFESQGSFFSFLKHAQSFIFFKKSLFRSATFSHLPPLSSSIILIWIASIFSPTVCFHSHWSTIIPLLSSPVISYQIQEQYFIYSSSICLWWYTGLIHSWSSLFT